MVQSFDAYLEQALKDFATYLRTKPTKEASFALGLKLTGAKHFAMFLAGTPPPEPFAGRPKRAVSK